MKSQDSLHFAKVWGLKLDFINLALMKEARKK